MSGEGYNGWEVAGSKKQENPKTMELKAIKTALRSNDFPYQTFPSGRPVYSHTSVRTRSGNNLGGFKDVIVYFKFVVTPSHNEYLYDLHFDQNGNHREQYDHLMTNSRHSNTFEYHSDSSSGITVHSGLQSQMASEAKLHAVAAVATAKNNGRITEEERDGFRALTAYYDELEHFGALDTVYGQQYHDQEHSAVSIIGQDPYFGAGYADHDGSVQMIANGDVMSAERAVFGLLALCILAMIMLTACAAGAICGCVGATVCRQRASRRKEQEIEREDEDSEMDNV